jgi:hypothetical protein
MLHRLRQWTVPAEAIIGDNPGPGMGLPVKHFLQNRGGGMHPF